MRPFAVLSFLLAASACNCGGRVAPISVELEVAPRSIDFGVRSPGSVTERSVSFTAHGAALKLDGAAITDDARGVFSVAGAPAQLAEGETAMVTVSYAPASPGADSATLTVSLASEGLDDISVALVGRSLAGDPEADAGSPDAGSPDSGLPDSGVADAGQLPDAGPPRDAGQVDAGPPRFDGGECPGTGSYGYARWPTFGRVNLPDLHWEGSDWTVFFYGNASWYGRFDALGQPLNGSLQQISAPMAVYSLFPRAARGPSDWGVVYTEDYGGTGSRSIAFARVSLGGAVTAGSKVTVTPSSQGISATIAFNPLDAEYGVLHGTGSQIGFLRVSAAGAVVAGSERTVTSAASSAYRIGNARSLIWSGTRWVIVWPEAGGVMLEEIDRQGDLISSSRTVVMPSSAGESMYDAAVAASSTQYAVAWQHNTSNIADTMVRFARVNAGGGVVPSSAIPIGGSMGISSNPDLVWDGSAFFVAFAQQYGATGTNQRIALTTVTQTGQVLTLAKVLTCGTPGDDFSPRVEWNGSAHAVAWARQYVPPGATMVTQEGRVLLIP